MILIKSYNNTAIFMFISDPSGGLLCIVYKECTSVQLTIITLKEKNVMKRKAFYAV